MTSVVFTVTGIIDFQTALALRKMGDQWIEQNESVVIDFQAVDRCNSVGLAIMTAWWRRAKQLGKIIRFTNVPTPLQRIAVVCGVAEILGMK